MFHGKPVLHGSRATLLSPTVCSPFHVQRPGPRVQRPSGSTFGYRAAPLRRRSKHLREVRDSQWSPRFSGVHGGESDVSRETRYRQSYFRGSPSEVAVKCSSQWMRLALHMGTDSRQGMGCSDKTSEPATSRKTYGRRCRIGKFQAGLLALREPTRAAIKTCGAEFHGELVTSHVHDS